MKQKYISPASASIDLFGEELMIAKISNVETGASDALTNQKDFGHAGGWNSESWTAEEE